MSKSNKHNKKYKIIGEGGYGCVHMPALPCKDNDKKIYNGDDNYVSKLMTNKHAKKELDEFLIIGKLDKEDEYHLGEPIICNPDVSSLQVVNDISKCKHISVSKVMLTPNDYRLLLIKYGGVDLDDLCMKELNNYFGKSNKAVDKFWLEAHQLFKGLAFFEKNKIVHYDIKPQNILYNPELNQLRFIDFGLMRGTNKIISESHNSNNGLGVIHWSYPIDNGFTNKKDFYKCKEAGKLFNKEILKMFMTYSNKNSLGIDISNIDGFYVLFKYITLGKENLSSEDRAHYVNRFLNAFQNIKSYEEFLNKVVKTIDIYGLGFTLKYVLNSFYRHKLIEKEFYNKCTSLFEDMYNFDFINRVSSAEECLTRYEQILLETDILTKLGKTIENHRIRTGKPLETYLPARKIKSRKNISRRNLSELVDKDVLELMKSNKSSSFTRRNKNNKRRFRFSIRSRKY
jgi:serine/threonine protein kinase